MFHLHIEAIRAVAHALYRMGRLDEALAHCEDIVRRTEGKDPRLCRLQLGPTHVRVQIAMGRIDDARAALAAYADLVAQCQSPLADRLVARLRTEIESRA